MTSKALSSQLEVAYVIYNFELYIASGALSSRPKVFHVINNLEPSKALNS